LQAIHSEQGGWKALGAWREHSTPHALKGIAGSLATSVGVELFDLALRQRDRGGKDRRNII